MHGHRDPSAVIGDLDAPVFEDAYVDLGGEARHRLVDGVVDDLPDQVVESTLTGGADVHTRALADRFQTLENFDRIGAVLGGTIVLLGSHVERVSLGLGQAEACTGNLTTPSRITWIVYRNMASGLTLELRFDTPNRAVRRFFRLEIGPDASRGR